MPSNLSVDERALLACCACPRWAGEMLARQPYPDIGTLRKVSDAVFVSLDWTDLEQAIAAHPRIGERATGQDLQAGWSRAEQSAAATADQRIQDELRQGNLDYERRFGHVFLICATGRSATDILAQLRARLDNDEGTERGVVREELRKIVNLRLEKAFAR